MIRIEGNEFKPGSVPPRIPLDKLSDSETTVSSSTRRTLDVYFGSRLWEKGEGMLILGGAASGKTHLGMYVMRRVHDADPSLHQAYWTEVDFLADLRYLWRFEDMTSKVPKDDALWQDYLSWERAYHDLREAPMLFLDDVLRGYTPMHAYELETLLRHRDVKGLPTIMAGMTGSWDNAPAGIRSVVQRTMAVVSP